MEGGNLSLLNSGTVVTEQVNSIHGTSVWYQTVKAIQKAGNTTDIVLTLYSFKAIFSVRKNMHALENCNG